MVFLEGKKIGLISVDILLVFWGLFTFKKNHALNIVPCTKFQEFAWAKFPNFICWNFYKNLFLAPFSTFFRWIDPTSLDDHLCGLLAWKNTAKAIRFVFFFFHLSTHSVRFYTSRYYILKTTIIFLVKWNCSLVLFVHFVYVSKCLQNGSFQRKKKNCAEQFLLLH